MAQQEIMLWVVFVTSGATMFYLGYLVGHSYSEKQLDRVLGSFKKYLGEPGKKKALVADVQKIERELEGRGLRPGEFYNYKCTYEGELGFEC